MSEFITHFQDNTWLIILICSIAGYLIGAISFARLIHYVVTKSTKVSSFSEPVPHSDEIFESDLVSATLITKKLGTKYGCITSILDMLKIALPTLFIKMTFTTHPFFLIVALFGIIGHNYPIYYSFVGGRGESPIIGALIIINWFGILIANAAALILGFITGSVLVVRWGGYFVMIFWFWYYFNDIFYVAFMVLANILFYLAMSKDLLRFRELKVKKGIDFSEEDVSEFILMGRSLGRTLDKYGLYYIIKRRINFNKKI
jgi:acyl phosphate:glycerol-3-phosphate acyltransferase